MKELKRLKRLLEGCAEDSSRKECMRSRRIYEYRKFSEGKSNWNEDLGDRTFVIPDGETEIEAFAFKDRTDLESITIPESVSKIGKFAFAGCTSMESIVTPESVIEIGEGAF